MLHAIQESDSDESRVRAIGEPISSGGSLTDPRSGDEGYRDELSAGNHHADSPEREAEKRVDAALEKGGAGLLLALVRQERAKMSTAVLGSADGLSSAVMLARKKLAANVAAVEAAVRAEKEALERSRAALSTEEGFLKNVPEGQRDYATELRSQVIELEAREAVLTADKAAGVEELAVLRGELQDVRDEMQESRQKSAALAEENGKLRAEVEALRALLEKQPYKLPPQEDSPPKKEQAPPQEKSATPPPEPQAPAAPAATQAVVPAAPAERSPPAEREASPPRAGPVVVQPRQQQQQQQQQTRSPQRQDVSDWGEQTEADLGPPLLQGILKKKKGDHGIFEDAWKQRLRVTLYGSAVVCEAVVDGKPTGLKDLFHLSQWHVPPERRLPASNKVSKIDPLRFDFVNKEETKVPGWVSVQLVSFRTDTHEECTRWVREITRARERTLQAMGASA